jgi:hypothetical protein
MPINFTNGTLQSVTDGTSTDLLQVPSNFSNPNWPAFHAYRDAGHITADATTIVFNGTRYNNGSYYDTSTGIFTAPVDGTYWFHVYSMDYLGTTHYVNRYLRLRYNNTASVATELRIYTSSPGAYRSHRTGGWVYKMSAGDNIRVITQNADVYGTSYVYLYFDGALLG